MAIEHEGDTWRYRSRRRWPRGVATSELAVRVGDPIPPEEVTDLDHFLSARWALGTRFGRRLMWANVDHPRWPLHRAEALAWDESLIAAAGLPGPEGEPHALWSPGVEVRIALPHRTGARR